MKSLSVLIVGGGVAGPALAYWLSRTGAKITLVERAAQIRAYGQQVDIRDQGAKMMRMMGIYDDIVAAAVHEPGTQLIDSDGKTKAYFPAAPSGSGKQSFTSEFEIMRGDLVKILYKLTEGRSNVRHMFNTTITELTQDPETNPSGKVQVEFQDGRAEVFDMVVGADGSGSRTRKLMLGLNAQEPRRRLGGFIGFFSVAAKPTDSEKVTVCHLPGSRGSRIIGTRKDCQELTRVYMLTDIEDPAIEAAYKSGDLEPLKKAWSDLFQDGGWECERFTEALRHAPEADDLYCTPFEELNLPPGSWSKGQVALIGDAAQLRTGSGFGTTCGLLGAYILAGEIATACSKNPSSPRAAVVQAAKNYEQIFRPKATQLHGTSSKLWSLFFPKSSTGIFLLHSFARLAAQLGLDRMGDNENKSKWVVPEYPALNNAL